MTLALLEVDGLSIDLPVQGQLRSVLRDVSFAIDEGQTVGLVGESGSGKSMTARAVARLLPPGARTRGQVVFDGASVLDLRGAALRRYRGHDLSIIFQDPRAHTNPVRRIGDFLTEALRINRGISGGESWRQAHELLAAVGIHDGERRMRQYPHELSGGLLQRVMIAAALAVRPRLVLADEPTTALDVTTQAEVMGILGRLQREYGMAMLFITHDLDLAAAVCDETIVMYAGCVVEQQSGKRLHTDPLHPYTAALGLARPEVSQRLERLHAIAGDPTTAFEAPAGCPFSPRCPYAESPCETPQPLRRLDTGRTRCRRMPELRGTLLDRSPSLPGQAATDTVVES